MAAENNAYFISPANPLSALMAGTQGYDRGRKAAQDSEIAAARQEAEGIIRSGGDPGTALARLIAGGDVQGATVYAKLHESQTQQNGSYGNVIYGQGPNGETLLGTNDRKGNFKQMPTPGFTPTLPVKTLDTGTGYQQIPGRAPFVGGQPSAAAPPPGSVSPQENGQPRQAVQPRGDIPPALNPSYNVGPQPRTALPGRPPGFAPPAPDNNNDPAFTISPEQSRRANQPMPGQTQPAPQPGQAASNFIPKDIEGKEAQEAAGKRIGETMAAASKAPQALANLSRASALLSQIETGKLLPAQMTVASWGRALGLSDENIKSMGLDPKAPAMGQAAQSLFNEMIIGKLGPGGFPSANFSNTDLKFITGTVMGLGDEPAANKIRLEAARRIEQQKIEKVNQWRAFKKENSRASFDDFEAQWNNAALQKDLFGDLQRDADALIARATQQPAPGPAQSAPQQRAVVPQALQSRPMQDQLKAAPVGSIAVIGGVRREKQQDGSWKPLDGR